MDKFFINEHDTALLIIDIQDKLAAAMRHKDQVVNNCLHLIELAKLLSIPILVTEQYPKGLGTTLPEIKAALPEYAPFEKTAFNCCLEAGFLEKVASLGKKKLLLTGMETHICVLQTGIGLMKEVYAVQVIQDAVCSRTKNNYSTGLAYLDRAGAVITGTETVLFQLLQKAGTEAFKVISKRIK
ncbi:MAG: hydrolase [Desulfobacca sp.]|nr:hydrolase [Desulfobacca sp.]